MWTENWLDHQAGRVTIRSVIENNWWRLSQMLMPILFNLLSYNLDNGINCTLRKLYFPAVLGAFLELNEEVLLFKKSKRRNYLDWSASLDVHFVDYLIILSVSYLTTYAFQCQIINYYDYLKCF